VSEDCGDDAKADGDGREGDEYNEVMALRKTVGKAGRRICAMESLGKRTKNWSRQSI
jgi:hypothetical protein